MKQFVIICCFLLSVVSLGTASNITYTNITQGNYTEVNVEVSISSLNDLFAMSRNFVNIVFKPFTTIEEFVFSTVIAANGDPGQALNDLISQWQKLLAFEAGYAACAVFGILFVILTILVGLIMCACRTCCDNCGGKMVQSHSRAKSKWRHCFCVSLLILSVLIAIPCVFVFLTNEWTTDVLKIIPDKTTTIFNDTIAYLDTVPKQLDEIVVQYGEVDSKLRTDLGDLGTTIGEPVRDTFISYVTPSLNQLEQLSNDSKDALDALVIVESDTATLDAEMTVLETELTNEKNELDVLLSEPNCNGDPTCSALQSTTSNLDASGANFTSLGDVEKVINTINETLVRYNIDAEIAKVMDELNNIPELITNGSKDSVDELLATLTEIDNGLNNSLSELPLQTVEDLKTSIERISSDVVAGLQTYDNNFDVYRYIAGVVLASMVAIIVLFYWLGMGMGTLSFTKNPEDRSGCSNCGGIFIMTAVGFTFIFAWLFMILVILSFTVGGHGERYFCQNFENPYEGLKFTDRVLYELGVGFSTVNPNANVTVYELITDCQNDASIYEALKLEYLYNVTELVQNTTEQANAFRDELSKVDVDLSSIQVFTPEIQDALNGIKNSGLDGINFTAYTNQISIGLTQANLTEYARILNETANSLSGTPGLQSTADALRNHANNILQIQEDIVDPLIPVLDSLNSSISKLENLSRDLNQSVDATTESLERLNDTIQTNGSDIVLQEVETFADVLIDDVNGFTAWLLLQMTEFFGACRPVFLVYTQAVSLACDYFMDILNGLWFSLGWCVFFLIPAAIVGMKLAKFYRRTGTDAYNDTQWDNMEMDAFNRSHNNGNRTSSAKFRSPKVHPGEYY